MSLGPMNSPGLDPSGFAGYTALERIGHGAMGSVYRAWHKEHSRQVALKILSTGPEAPVALRDRFREEIRALGALDHPNIVPLFETGEIDGTPYYSMKLVDGPSLASLLADRTTPVAATEAAQWVRTIALAVHHAHEHGVLHRDLKPSNILMENSREPQIVDFGVAKLEFSNLDLTQTLSLVGTVPYMSPEQAAGDAKKVTVATDIWSLGVILHELLTLRVPFQGDNREEILRRIREDEPPNLQALNRQIDRDLTTICRRCLVKEPHGRYASAEALAEDLRRWLEHEPILARHISGPERFVHWCRRRPALAALAGVSVVALMLGGASIANWRASRRIEAQGRFYRHVLDLNLANNSLDEGSFSRAHAFLDGDGWGSGPDDRSEIEWQLLKVTAEDQDRRTLLATNGPVLAIAANNADRTFAVALPGQLLFWTEGSSAHTTWPAPWFRAGEVALALDEPNRRIIAASARAITAYSWTSGQSERWATNGGNRLAWSPERQRLAIGRMSDSNLEKAGTLVIMEGSPLKPIATFPQIGTAALQWTQDGQELLVAARNGAIAVWNATNTHLQNWFQSKATTFQAAFSPDGSRVARIEDGGRLVLSDIDGGERVEVAGRTFPEHATQLIFLTDGKRLVVGGGADQRLHVFEARTGIEELALQGHRGSILGLAPLPVPNRLLSTSADGTLREWDVPPTRRTSPIRLPHNVANLEFQAPVFSPDGRYLAYLHQGSVNRAECRVWSVQSTQIIATVRGRPIRFSPDGSNLLAWDARRLGEYQLPQGTWREIPLALASPERLEPQMSQDGRRLFLLDRNRQVSALERPSTEWKPIGQCALKAGWFQPTPDGRGIVALGEMKAVYWEVAANRITVLAEGSQYDAVGISGGSDLAAIGDWHGNIRVFALPSGRPLEHYVGDAGGITALAFARQGRTLLSGSMDGYVRFFNREAQRQSLSLRLGGEVGWLRFAPEDGMLLAGTRSTPGQTNGTYYLWPIGGRR